MSRRASGAGTATAKQPTRIELVDEILEWKKNYALVAAVLGPPRAEKTALLKRAARAATDRGFKVVSVDLVDARELVKVDDFYVWLVRKLREDWWHGVRTASPRLDFCNLLGQALGKRRQPVLLILDHVEWVAESCAHQLVSDLREVQDRGDADPAWGRLRCVIAGQVSVYQLRRRGNSPNLQFRLHILPAGNRPQAEDSTRKHLKERKVSCDESTMRYLAEQTGGELAFLRLLDGHLSALRIGIDDARNAVQSILSSASQYPHLCKPAWLYVLDEEFKAKAHQMLDRSPLVSGDPTVDIDRYQLAGAWITGFTDKRERHFRNGLVESTVRDLRSPDRTAVDPKLMELTRLQHAALSADDTSKFLEYVSDAWRYIGSQDGRAELLLQYEGRKGVVAVNGFGASERELPDETVTITNGGEIHTEAGRIRGNWMLDTSWPGSERPLLIRIYPENGFWPCVAARETSRLWSLFLKPLGGVALQLGLQALGRHTLRSGLGAGPKKIFVSSTYLDLINHRRAVLEQIVRRDLLFRGMEFFGAEPASTPPAEKIVREVREADVYLGIFGIRYGSVDPKSGRSMTELEYNEAESAQKQMLLYVMRDDAAVKVSDFDPETEPKRRALLNRVMDGHTGHMVYKFSAVDDLARQVYEDLGKL